MDDSLHCFVVSEKHVANFGVAFEETEFAPGTPEIGLIVKIATVVGVFGKIVAEKGLLGRDLRGLDFAFGDGV